MLICESGKETKSEYWKNNKKQQILIENGVHIANKIGRLLHPSRHFAYVNNVYDIELGHKSRDHCLIRNIKH